MEGDNWFTRHRPTLVMYGCAVLAVVFASAVRILLVPLVGDRAPHATFLIAVAFMAWYGGFWPAIATLLLGTVAAITLFMNPADPLFVTGSPQQWALALYLVTGSVVSLLGAARRRAMSRAIERSEDLEQVLQHMTEGFVVFDRQWRFVYLNDRAVQLARRPREQLIGRRVWDMFPKNVTTQGYESMQRAVREQKPFHEELYVPQIDRWVEVHVYPAPDGVTVFAADVTDRIHARRALRDVESRHRAILQAMLDGLITIDERGTVESFNPAAERLFGFRAHEIIGSNIGRLIPSPDREQLAELLRDSVLAGNPRMVGTGREVRGLRKDGATFPMDLSVSELKTEGKRLFIALVHDITERKRGEQQREELLQSERSARSDAEHASRMKDEFLASVSHELRTPLNAILGWAQLLGRAPGGSPNPADLRQAIETIQRSARAQSQLIEDLLDMSRITTGNLRLDIQRVDLRNVVEAAIASVRPAAEAKQITLDVDLDTELEPARGDPTRLQQVAWNLLSNAIKFTPKRGRVEVRTHPAVNGGNIELVVRDDGIGIKPDFMPHLFGRFRQADSSTTRRHAGLGLGLAIVRHLVEMHGGTVTASSDGEGTGATFCVSLPAVQAPEHEEPAMPIGAIKRVDPQEISTGHSLRGVEVLVVDDEPDARELLRRLLSENDAAVRAVASAAEAMREIQTHPPHVLVSDIGMPEEDGFMLIRKVRTLPPNRGGAVPAVALTAFARAEDRDRAIHSGYQSHLAKPVEPVELIANIAALAGRGTVEV
ncbi:MAG TPA: PAS domain S-box protein [Tepidisphaeraceae bacterium]|jgi:PAS domain S-box-containing protein